MFSDFVTAMYYRKVKKEGQKKAQASMAKQSLAVTQTVVPRSFDID